LRPPRLYALVPAAGSGSRFGANSPKQYTRLGRATMLEHALVALLAEPRIERALVVVAPDDRRIDAIVLDARVQVARVGGASRAASVRAGLQVLAAEAGDDDWVLVHDAARPCLSAADLAALIDALRDDPVGGLLAMPLSDTVKRGAGGRVAVTLERADLWRAATPQMFRIGLLRAALDAPGALDAATDEASAAERAGHAPRLVACDCANLKVTRASDLPLARAILAAQGRL